MNDATSAEAYCTLGREIVPAKTAQQIGERSDLQPWATLVTSLAAPCKSAKSDANEEAENGGRRGEEGPGYDPHGGLHERRVRPLPNIARQVTLNSADRREATADRTAQLLNSQAMNLNVVDVRACVRQPRRKR